MGLHVIPEETIPASNQSGFSEGYPTASVDPHEHRHSGKGSGVVGLHNEHHHHDTLGRFVKRKKVW